MRESPARPRIASKLSVSLDQHLNFYALAASAASVSLLALAQPSEAKIIYTKTHQIIGTNGVYPLELNNDGIIDFLVQESGAPFSVSTGSNCLGVKEAFGNAVEGSIAKYGTHIASALGKGALIGSRQRFISRGSLNTEEVMVAVACSIDLGCRIPGQWVNADNRYLGLRLQVNGKAHYGWARLSVQMNSRNYQITAALTGYAYETVPDKGIRAGQMHGATDAASDLGLTVPAISKPSAAVARPGHSASLGQLALGNRGIPLWRQP